MTIGTMHKASALFPPPLYIHPQKEPSFPGVIKSWKRLVIRVYGPHREFRLGPPQELTGAV